MFITHMQELRMACMQLLLILTIVVLQDSCLSQAAIAVDMLPMKTTHCEFYNETMCAESRNNGIGTGCNEKEECDPQDPGKRSHCFVLWRKDPNGNLNITLKGCFLNNEDCYNKTECVEKAQNPKKDFLFCCCEGNMCNQNFTWKPTPTEPPVQAAPEPVPMLEGQSYIIIVVSSVFVLIIIFMAAFFFYRHRKNILFNELPTTEPHPTPPPSPQLGLRPIQLVEIKARGRFGAVYKALLNKSQEVAVKIFPIQDKQSWIAEQDIYKLPHMDHPNILHYIGVEKRGDNNLHAEFWLITEYHELGSLCDYLKAYTVSWQQLCLIAETMAKGLMHIHEEISGNKLYGFKPALAHRDFKSKNVLLKQDKLDKNKISACIADFGLALVFQPGKPCGDTHGQVGTRRYMAPEVLEGAINFTRDAFLRIDMYACGLVLWELASRCSAQDGPIPEYRLPFEEEVGQHPTLEDMQESVVQRKVRPTIPETWRTHKGLQLLCDTMEECWDHDAEARLSASCVMERVALHNRYQNISSGLRIENEAPLSPNKESSI